MFDLIYVGNYRPQVGGAAISCHQLMAELARAGCRCRVLASATQETAVEADEFDASVSSVEVQRFQVPYYFNAPHREPPADWAQASRAGVQAGLEQMIGESKPDALIVREGWAAYASPIAARLRIPTVVLVRGNPTSAVLRGVYPPPLADAFLGELARADRVVTVGRHFMAGLADLGLRHVQCISNLVDLTAFAPRSRDPALASRHGITSEDIVVLSAGQMKDIKRPVDVARSAAAALRDDPRLLYLFVGDGELRDEIERTAISLGIGNRVRFQPFVAYESMPAYMNLADIVVVPSEAEGLARVYLEAQACSKTLLSSDIPAAREVVDHGRTGLLFRMGDVSDLAEKTVQAARDPELRSQLGAAARERVQVHGADRIAREYLRVIEEVTRAAHGSDK